MALDNDRLQDFVITSLIGITVSIVLALGHVTYGINFTSITAQDIALLDSYVFFLSYATVTLIATTFYYFKQDITSTLGVIINGFTALTFGFQDLTVYLLLGYTRQTYPWLTDSPAGIMANLLGTPVTTPMLIYNALVFGTLATMLSYSLFLYEDKIFGIEI